jgi:IS4 transposase
VNALDFLDYEKGGFYIFDRAYVDFYRLNKIHREKVFFIVRAKNSLKFKRMYSSPVNKQSIVCSDQIGRLTGFYSLKNYPEKLRRVKFYDEENKKYIVVLTNNMELISTDIALLYRYRWNVEIFFRWIKQHLKIKSFWGTTENAVKIQIYIAIITYTLVAIIKSKLNLEKSIYEILQILSFSLIDKTPIIELFTNQNYQDVKELNYNQLKLF